MIEQTLTAAESAATTAHNPLYLAASWYTLSSKDFGKKPKAVTLFGKDMVAWRGAAGQPVLMDRYCSHMGSSLARGVVENGCISCPFHNWRFDAEGKCVSAPEVEVIPAAARQKVYPVVERYGWVWVWYGTPQPLFPPPVVPEAEDKNYVSQHFAYTATTPTRRIAENNFDYRHLWDLHGVGAGDIAMEIRDRNAQAPDSLLVPREAWIGVQIDITQDKSTGLTGVFRHLVAPTETIKIDGWPSGHVFSTIIGGQTRARFILSLTPISENKTVLNTLFLLHKGFGLFNDLFTYVTLGASVVIGNQQDGPNWNTLNDAVGGAYVPYDRAVLEFRQFYQSWVDRVQPEA